MKVVEDLEKRKYDDDEEEDVEDLTNQEQEDRE
jgi:hypothetical protein